MARLLIIESMEPLSLPRKQITGPRYYQPALTTFSVPQPTTILGVLGVALGIHIERARVDQLEDIDIVLHRVMEKLECSSPLILGPVLITKNNSRAFIPIAPNLYVDLTRINEILTQVNGGHSVNMEVCHNNAFTCIEPHHVILTGVSLTRTGGVGSKTVKLGHMYKYPIVVYRDKRSGEVVEVCITYVLNCARDMNEFVSRVGGEGRLAKLRIDEDRIKLSERLLNPLTGLRKGTYISISYIPIIPFTHNLLELSLDGIIGLEFLNSIDDIIGIPQETVPPKISIERLGLGFSEATKKRRPLILALPPGTILKIANDLRREPIKPIKILWNIGYATLLQLS